MASKNTFSSVDMCVGTGGDNHGVEMADFSLDCPHVHGERHKADAHVAGGIEKKAKLMRQI